MRAMSQVSKTEVRDHIVREVRELVRLTRKYGLPSWRTDHTGDQILQIYGRLAHLQKFVSPNYRWRWYYPLPIISGYRQSTAILRNILAADAGARPSRWTQEEREEFALLIQHHETQVFPGVVAVTCIHCSGLAFVGYWILRTLGAC